MKLLLRAASAVLALSASACDCRTIILQEEPSGGGGSDPQGGSNPQGGFGGDGGVGGIVGGFGGDGGVGGIVGGFGGDGGFGGAQGGFGGDGGFGGAQGGFGGVGGDGGTGGGFAICGNGLVEPGEECDDTDLDGFDCTVLGFVNPTGVDCTAICTLDFDDCQATCGNMVIEPTEACDDGNAQSGDGCSAQCQIEQDTCDVATPVMLGPGTMSLFGSLMGAGGAHAPSGDAACGPGVGGGPEKVYAVTVSQQGHLTAYVPSAGTSFNTSLYLRSTCDDQASQLSCHDNDAGAGSGELVSAWVNANQTVYVFVDTGGASTGDFELRLDLSRGGSCSDPAPVTIEGSQPITLRGRTSSLTDDGGATGCNGDGTGPDAVWAITFAAADAYDLDLTTSAFNSVSYAKTSCQMGEIACDSPPGTNDSSLSLMAGTNQTLFYWVDSVTNQSGAYAITITH